MYRVIFFFFCFNILFHNVLGNIPDSLENTLKLTVSDTAKVMVYNRFAQSLLTFYRQNQDYHQALQYAQQGLELAKEINFKNGEAELYRTIGNAFYYLNNNEQAIAHYETALQLCEQLQLHNNIALIYYNLGIVYRRLSKYFYSLDNFQKSLSVWSQLGNIDRMGLLYRGIVQLYILVMH